MSVTGKRKIPNVETRQARKKRLKREEQEMKGLRCCGCRDEKPATEWDHICNRSLLWQVLAPTGTRYPLGIYKPSWTMMQARFGDFQDAVTQDDIDKAIELGKTGADMRFPAALRPILARDHRILFWVCTKYMGNTAVPPSASKRQIVTVIASFTVDPEEVGAECDLMKRQLAREKEQLMQLMSRATFHAGISFRTKGYKGVPVFATLRMNLTRTRRSNHFTIKWIDTLRGLEDGALPKAAVSSYGEIKHWPPRVATYTCSSTHQVMKEFACLPTHVRVRIWKTELDTRFLGYNVVLTAVRWKRDIIRACLHDARMPVCLQSIVTSYLA